MNDTLDQALEHPMHLRAKNSTDISPAAIFAETFYEEELDLVARELESMESPPRDPAAINYVLTKAGIRRPPARPNRLLIGSIGALVGLSLFAASKVIRGSDRS